LVDFHCHLDLYPDFSAMATECEVAGVCTLAVTTTPKAWGRNRDIAQRTRHVRAALGLHPQLVADRAGELPLWEMLLAQTRYVGEVGLDAGPRFYRSIDLQIQVFDRILHRCAEQGGKILSVHSVRAATVVLDLLEARLPPSNGCVVLHWFTGSASEARRAVDLGCYFSINANMFQSERLRETIRNLPLNRLLTETDGPFTTTDGRANRPSDVRASVEALATLRGMDPETVVAIVRSNLAALLSAH